MNIIKNVSLRDHSTMRLGGNARFFAVAKTTDELTDLLTWAKNSKTKYVVIGDGSNIIWQDKGYDGIVIVNKIMSYIKQVDNSTNTALFTFGAGENWDESVKKTVELGYSGLEQLSLIPGTVGAAPVQNIGAYGKEIKDVLVSVRAYDSTINKFIDLTNAQCEFGYRTSCFKVSSKGRYVIVSVALKLKKGNPKPPFYASLQTYLDKNNITDATPDIIRNAVKAIRKSKLPNPKIIANNGSFFTNPIIDDKQAQAILLQSPNAPNWPTNNGKTKLSAAWLIEQVGFTKGYQDPETGMALWSNQALVFVNVNAKSTSDLLKFRQKIITSVRNKFNITLAQEPELI